MSCPHCGEQIGYRTGWRNQASVYCPVCALESVINQLIDMYAEQDERDEARLELERLMSKIREGDEVPA